MLSHDWGYDESDGPAQWASFVPAASGSRQSPIVITPSKAMYDSKLQENPLRISYHPVTGGKMHNHGRSVQTDVDGPPCFVEGGPLSHRYQLKQFHFHWGKTSATGAEHRIDDKVYAAELHFVHWNTGLYHTIEEAAHSPNGLGVLCIFIEPGEEHPGIDNVTKLLSQVQYRDDYADLPDGFNPASLLPEDTSRYWTYVGSLTTPPCWETVTFVLFKQPIRVSERQLDVFRSLYKKKRDACCGDSCHLVNNYRPTMPLNGRSVSASFRKFFT